MKKKRFYKNVERDQTWTEPEQGREIDFADKYLDEGIYSDKYDYLRPKKKRKEYLKKDKVKKFFKNFGIVICAILILNVGYIFMDVYMYRHAMPDISSQENEQVDAPISEVKLDLKAEYVDSVSLDGGVMLDSVVTSVQSNVYNSVAFDIKRMQGTIGYRSALANVDTFGAIAFPANNLKGSVSKLSEQDILPVGIVHCYLDNLVPAVQQDAAILNSNGIVYRDSMDNTYLNPDSETTYNYIEGIIAEANEMGVNVFVLDNVNLPKNISSNYNDGFEYLAKKLYKDVGTNIKLVEAVNVDLTSSVTQDNPESEKALVAEIQKKCSKDLGSNKVYVIKTIAQNKTLVKQKLEENGINNFILSN